MALVFGVLSYLNDSLSDASGNIGDSIQTLAALNCYRHALRLDMPFAEFLERVLTDSVPGARFVFVSRDCSHRQKLPPRVVTLMNGWFMHPGRHNAIEWPMNASVEPVFVSFHLADDRLLSPVGIEYFKRHQPIGCRDVATVDRLRAHGIEAYFTGCLTLTIDFLPWNAARSEELFVDVARQGRPTIRHWDPLLANRDPAALLRRALSLLRQYAAASKVTTSRLHCFLPCIAMGVPVTLTQVDLRDPRLRGVDTWDYTSLKHGLAVDVGERLARFVPAALADRPAYDVCFAVDDDTAAHLPVAVSSIVHTNRHARIRIHLVHPHGVAVPALEGVEVLSYPVPVAGSAESAAIGFGDRFRERIPDLIGADIRLLCLDVAVVVNMSLESLFAVDPGPTGIAMRSAPRSGRAALEGGWAAGKPLPGADASRWGDAGVMLMDLATLRRNRFAQVCRSHGESADDEISINRYCAGDFAELRREWNLLPRIDSGIVADTDHYILQYSGPEKPWSSDKPEYWQVWNWYSRRMRRRAAVVQAASPGAASADSASTPTGSRS
jgi:hypothetical protein